MRSRVLFSPCSRTLFLLYYSFTRFPFVRPKFFEVSYFTHMLFAKKNGTPIGKFSWNIDGAMWWVNGINLKKKTSKEIHIECWILVWCINFAQHRYCAYRDVCHGTLTLKAAFAYLILTCRSVSRSLTNSSGVLTSRLKIVFAQRHHHHWSSVVHGCRLLATELFRSPLPIVSGTNYDHVTSRL